MQTVSLSHNERYQIRHFQFLFQMTSKLSVIQCVSEVCYCILFINKDMEQLMLETVDLAKTVVPVILGDTKKY